MEKLLLKVYKRLVPRWIKARVSDDLKDWLLGSLIFLVSRPDLKSLRLRRLAMASVRKKDWRAAVEIWQEFTAATQSISMEDAARQDEMLRKARYGRNELRKARLNYALQLRSEGRRRAFCELTNRIVESIPDQRVFKKERNIIDLVRHYVQDALLEDAIHIEYSRISAGKPLRIAFCLDILKISDIHTHSRVLFSICRNLMNLDPKIETHIIITHERLALTTPIISTSFNIHRDDFVHNMAKIALPDHYGSRFFVHIFKNSGLEGIVQSCKNIIEINPDVLVYGGGHRGLFSNESRSVRHCLYDWFPTAFLFIQANNEVDEKNDVIITRGPHKVIGSHGNAKIIEQPYPTISSEEFRGINTSVDPKKADSKIIITAISGVRMVVLMQALSDVELRELFSVLDTNPGTVWHFIGAPDPDLFINSNPHICKRVAQGQLVVHPVLPFAEFKNLMGRASLFLHLPGFTGGSGGASVARRNGVPILTFSHSDVSGRQPIETVFDEKNISDFVKMATLLLNNRTEWIRIVQLQFAHTKWIYETSPQGFYNCLSEAFTLGVKRVNQRPKQVWPDKAEPPGLHITVKSQTRN